MDSRKELTKLSLLMAGVLICFSSYGQKDKVFLKNGSLIKGSISAILTEEVKVITGNSELNLVVEDIRYVKFSKASHIDEVQIKRLQNLVDSYFDKGISVMLSTGMQVGAISGNESSDATWTSQGVVLYKFDPKIQLGISVGYDQHESFNAAPVSIYYRGDIAKSPGGLFAYSSIGTSNMWRSSSSDIRYNDVEGGRIIQLGLGHSWDFKKSEIVMSVGWKRQKVKSVNGEIWEWGGNEFFVSRSINRMEMKIGVIF